MNKFRITISFLTKHSIVLSNIENKFIIFKLSSLFTFYTFIMNIYSVFRRLLRGLGRRLHALGTEAPDGDLKKDNGSDAHQLRWYLLVSPISNSRSARL